MLNVFRMVTFKPVFVSFRRNPTLPALDPLLTLSSAQTLPMSLTLCTPTTLWMPKPPRAGRRSTSSTSVSTCCPRCSVPICARCDPTSSDWPSASFGWAYFLGPVNGPPLMLRTCAGIGRRGQHRRRSFHQIGHRFEGGLHVRSCSTTQRRQDFDGSAHGRHPSSQLDRNQTPGEAHGRRCPQSRFARGQDPPRVIGTDGTGRRRGQGAFRNQLARRGVHAARQHLCRRADLQAVPADRRPAATRTAAQDQL